jgi:catechol 2,3-dioxygenase-like lactoylglutathione lyase family enzyme
MQAMAPVRLTAFAAVFTVAEVAASLRFYTERLGFKVGFQMDDPPTYAIVERDTVSLHLMPAAQEARGLGRSSIYVFVAGVDALHGELKGRFCPIESAPQDYFYGMREMSVRDPDGNRITFGQEVKKPGA